MAPNQEGEVTEPQPTIRVEVDGPYRLSGGVALVRTAQIQTTLGYSNGDEVIHRDNLIVF
jgi:hypothetical protein